MRFEALQSRLFATFDRLFKPGELILGFSGGVDSRLLLEMIYRYIQTHPQFSLRAIHVHHGLNPCADQWADYCAEQCHKLHIPLHIERIQLERQNRQSLEDIAREARYHIFRQSMHETAMLVTAHHQDDQLETMLLAMKRGSGPRGLAGMPEQIPFASGQLIRPCLFLSKEEVERWAIHENLSWIHDDSNENENFDRNFLRQSVIPLLKQRWPQIAATASRSMQLCLEQEALAEEIAQSDLVQTQYSNRVLNLEPFLKLSIPRQNQLLRVWLRQLTGSVPTQQQLINIKEQVIAARIDATPQLKWEKGYVARYQNQLWFFETLPQPFQPQPIDLSAHEWDLFNTKLTLSRSKHDPERIRLPYQHEEVTICCSLPGALRLQPVTRQHHRELKKLWQEYAVAPWLRNSWPVLCYNEQVVAVCGLFTCKAFACEQDEEGIVPQWQPPM